MKKVILSIALVIGLTNLSIAQDAATATPVKKQERKQERKDKTPEEKAKQGANWAEKKLGLTATQKSDWETATLKRIMVNQPIHEKLKGSTTPEERKELHTQIKTNRDAFDTSINGFLTPEQKTKYEAIKAQKQSEHKAKVKAGKAKEGDLESDIEG
ncbi:MAG: hypothetical protein Q7W45_05810 [Bacteroidota bacterium]|nr:hypothetical protein [Bacteroidota bacterium]MDP3144962.1 hypothetical protein [Bacteroidota bacterium]MDP3555994.1 hypothetical protein [Bacteroidota bacterium]